MKSWNNQLLDHKSVSITGSHKDGFTGAGQVDIAGFYGHPLGQHSNASRMDHFRKYEYKSARAPTRTNECLLNQFRGYGSMVHTEKCNTGLNIITNTLPSFRGREENQAHFFIWILTRHTSRAVPRASQRGRHHWQREEIDSFSKLETSSARRKWIGDGVGDGLACKLLTRACLLTGHAVQSRFRVTVEFWSNQLKKKMVGCSKRYSNCIDSYIRLSAKMTNNHFADIVEAIWSLNAQTLNGDS